VAQESAEVIGQTGEAVAGDVGQTAVPGCFYGSAQAIGDALVGVQTQHPVMAGLFDGKRLLATIAIEITMHDPCTAPRSQLRRPVRGAGIDDHHLVAKCHGIDAVTNPVDFVQSNDANADGWRGIGHKRCVSELATARTVYTGKRDPCVGKC